MPDAFYACAAFVAPWFWPAGPVTNRETAAAPKCGHRLTTDTPELFVTYWWSVAVNEEKQPWEPKRHWLKMTARQGRVKGTWSSLGKKHHPHHTVQARVCRQKDKTHLQAPHLMKEQDLQCKWETDIKLSWECWSCAPAPAFPPATRTCLCTCSLREAPLPLLQPALPRQGHRTGHPEPHTGVCVPKNSGLELTGV